MRIIGILHNQYSQSDFTMYLKDNYEGDSPPNQPVNTDSLERTKSGLPLLKIEFGRNERFNDLFWQGESISYVEDENTDFEKRGHPWSEFMELYESW